MNLPLRIRTEPSSERVISVDGAFSARGLNLSHWPGNTTPDELRHDLSTGSALLFAKLPVEERDRLAEGCTEICNNHVDTDGVLAMFAVARPEIALRFEEQLIQGSTAGDFFFPSDDEAFALDAIVTACLDEKLSPWRAETRDLDENARHEYDVRELVERLPSILDGGLEEYSSLWKQAVSDWHSDERDLESAAHDDLTHLDFSVWTANEGTLSSLEGSDYFDPSRRALFSTRFADRVLVVGPQTGGTTFRFILSTLSWFDQEGRACLPRPKLEALAKQLNELEGSDPSLTPNAWHAHSDSGASPELWFGTPGLPSFPERASSHLRLSKLDPLLVRAKIIGALRATWVFPD